MLLIRGFGRNANSISVKLALAVFAAVAMCAMGSPALGEGGLRFSTGLSGLEITPVIIEKELGRFLWLPDTRVGQFTVANRGEREVVVSAQIMGLTHDEDGNIDLMPCPPELANALILSPAGQIAVAPGSTGVIRVTLDRAYASRRDKGGLCVALVVAGVPIRSRLLQPGVEIGSCITLPVMVRLAGRDQARLAFLGVGAQGGAEDRPIVTMRVANEGAAYAKVDGRALISAADGSSAIEARITPALVLPGCVRACPLELPETQLLPGDYRATVQLRADGKAAGCAEFALRMYESGRVQATDITTSSPGRP